MLDIVDSGIYFNGLQVKKLEKSLKQFLKTPFITTLASGHDALSLSLSCLNLKEDDEIIFPVNSYPTAFPVCLSKGKPVPIDVDENGQMSLEALKKALNNKTKAVVLVHLYGNTTNIGGIKKLLEGKKITLIEDCAQSFGTTYKGLPTGTIGDIGCFSFYPTKNLATLGDGGAICTKNEAFSKYFLMAKSYGESQRFNSAFLSGHSRIPELQAGVLNFYFKKIKPKFNKRAELAQYYRKRIKEENLEEFIHPLSSDPESNPVPHLFVIRAKKRDSLKKFLHKNGVETGIHYPYPIHLLKAFAFLGYKLGDFPNAERQAAQILSLPINPFLKKETIDKIIKLIAKFYSANI